MKIVLVDQIQIADIAKMPVHLLPDSSLIRAHNPYYKPDYIIHPQARLYIYFRSNKVGKYLQPDFVSGYLNAYGFGFHFSDPNWIDRLSALALPQDIAYAYDASLAFSTLETLDLKGDDLQFKITLLINAEKQEIDIQLPIRLLSEIIAYLSTFFIVRIGDLFALDTDIILSDLQVGDEIRLTFKSKELIHVKIK